jgi:hypothetical protein
MVHPVQNPWMAMWETQGRFFGGRFALEFRDPLVRIRTVITTELTLVVHSKPTLRDQTVVGRELFGR